MEAAARELGVDKSGSPVIAWDGARDLFSSCTALRALRARSLDRSPTLTNMYLICSNESALGLTAGQSNAKRIQ